MCGGMDGGLYRGSTVEDCVGVLRFGSYLLRFDWLIGWKEFFIYILSYLFPKKCWIAAWINGSTVCAAEETLTGMSGWRP